MSLPINKGGRPKENAHMLLQRELSATLKTFGRARSVIENQIDIISKDLELAKDISISARIEIAKQLTETAASLASNVEKLAKYHMDKRIKSTEEDNVVTKSESKSDTIKNILGMHK